MSKLTFLNLLHLHFIFSFYRQKAHLTHVCPQIPMPNEEQEILYKREILEARISIPIRNRYNHRQLTYLQYCTHVVIVTQMQSSKW